MKNTCISTNSKYLSLKELTKLQEKIDKREAAKTKKEEKKKEQTSAVMFQSII